VVTRSGSYHRARVADGREAAAFGVEHLGLLLLLVERGVVVPALAGVGGRVVNAASYLGEPLFVAGQPRLERLQVFLEKVIRHWVRTSLGARVVMGVLP
jgi:hypothetical protein